jgi:hypothetical protein
MRTIYRLRIEVNGSTEEMFFDAFPTSQDVCKVIEDYSPYLKQEILRTLDSLEGNWFSTCNIRLQCLKPSKDSWRNVTLSSFDCHHINPINPDETFRTYGDTFNNSSYWNNDSFRLSNINDWDYLNSHSSYLHSLELTVPVNNQQYDVSPITQLFIASRPSNALSLVEIGYTELFEEIMLFSNKLKLTPEHLEEIRDICVPYKILSNEGWDCYEPNSKLSKETIKYDYFNWKD